MKAAQSFEISYPTPAEKGIAQYSIESIKQLPVITEVPAYLSIGDSKVKLPASAVTLLVEVLEQLAAGNSLTLIPHHASLTSQEAADLLSVSRPFLVKLLESGAIPFQRVGNRRRVLANDVICYKQKKFEESQQALQALSDQAQDEGMGY